MPRCAVSFLGASATSSASAAYEHACRAFHPTTSIGRSSRLLISQLDVAVCFCALTYRTALSFIAITTPLNDSVNEDNEEEEEVAEGVHVKAL